MAEPPSSTASGEPSPLVPAVATRDFLPDATGPARDPVSESWAEVLRDAGPSSAPGAGFVTSGGNSLRAARLTGLLLRHCGVTVPISVLLRDNASLAKLRGFVRDAPVAVTTTGQDTAVRRRTSPLAGEQRRLWVLARLHPTAAAYNVVAAVRLTGRLDLSRLRGSLDRLADRRDVLRARITTDGNGEPYWEYAPDSGLPLAVCTAQGELTPGVLDEFVTQLARTVLPLSVAPLARAALLVAPTGDDACLVLVVNHIVADQATLDLLLADLAAFYAATTTGTDPAAGAAAALVEPAPSYAEYAYADSQEAGSARRRLDLEYWQRSLADLPAEPSFPMRLRRAGPPAFRGEVTSRALGRGERLDQLLRDRGLTLMSFCAAAIAAVVSAWSGRRDVVLGVPVSRRRTPEETRLAGFLLGTVPLRLTVDENAGIAELARQAVRQLALGMEHSAVTFDAIVEHLGIRSRPDRNPVFQIWVNDMTGTGTAPRFAGLDARTHPQPMTAALFDLNWYIWRRADGYRLQLVRDVDLFPAEVADELADQVMRLITSAIDAPDRPVGDHDLVSARAAEVLPNPRVPLPGPGGEGDLAARVLGRAADHPAGTAVVAPDATLTYGELGDAVRRAAAMLADAGVPRDALVEIDAGRCLDYPVALLATWLHGAAAVIVDAATPPGRLTSIRATTRPVARLECSPVWAGGPRIGTAGAPSSGGTHDAGAGLSHVLFTSGSTAGALGVRVPHGPLHSFMTWYLAEFGLDRNDRFCLTAGLGHDPVLRDVLAPLLCGARLHIPSPATMSDPAELLDWLARNRITVMHATPALLELILAAREGTRRRLTDLRLLVCAGATLTAGLARRLREATDAVLVNAYGATETPQIAACHVVVDAAEAVPEHLPDEEPLPVGRGVAGRQVLVVTPRGSLTAPGQRGEIVVRGHHLAAGYVGDVPEACRFRPDPAGVAGIRWFATGDTGYVDPAGQVVVVGRADRQVSLNGFRLELGEVETAALAHPGIRSALAELRRTTAGEVLTLHLVPAPGHRPSVAAVRQHLGRLLPHHAVPAAIVIVDRMALNLNHKPHAGTEQAPSRGQVSAPGNAPDERLAVLAREVLGRPVDPDENFFDAGMNSMTLLRFHEALTREFHLNIPVTTLFTHVTLRTLSAHLGTPAAPNVHSGASGGRPGPARGSLRDAASGLREIRARVRESTGGAR